MVKLPVNWTLKAVHHICTVTFLGNTGWWCAAWVSIVECHGVSNNIYFLPDSSCKTTTHTSRLPFSILSRPTAHSTEMCNLKK